MKRSSNGIPVGPTTVEMHTGATGYPVQPPKWAGEDEERVPAPQSLYLTRQRLGWVLRLGDQPLISLNEGELEALGLTLIRATAR